LLAEWDEMKKLYRGPYIDAFCQVWFHLAQLFKRSRLKYEKVKGRTTDAMWWQYLWVRWAKKDNKRRPLLWCILLTMRSLLFTTRFVNLIPAQCKVHW
jgi:hypothetical protein